MPAYPYYQNPYQPTYFPYQQPTFQQPTQPVQQPQIQSGIIWVSGDAEASAYPVAPNSAVRLWHSSLPIVYFKSADASGKPTLKAYDLKERAQEASETVSTAETKTVEYATKSDLSAVLGVVKGFDELIGNIKSDIDSMKSDMYGIAGKKKVKKAKEEDEDE